MICWAAHGYAVLAPTHLDSTKRGIERYDQRAVFVWPKRVRELVALLDRAERGNMDILTEMEKHQVEYFVITHCCSY